MLTTSSFSFLDLLLCLSLCQLPAGSAVQQEAMQCYYMQFQSQDHSFLLQSNVFSNISKALSIPEEQQGEGSKACKDKVNIRLKQVCIMFYEPFIEYMLLPIHHKRLHYLWPFVHAVCSRN